MAQHWGGCCTQDICVKCGSIYAVLISPSAVFQDGGQAAISGFGLVSILFLFQILITYIN